MELLVRHNVTVSGREDGQPMVFAHGFGCDQHMWRFVSPAFEADHKVVLFDHIGAGESDLSAYDPDRYSTLGGYADDVVAICRELGLEDVIFVGHSVSAMIGVLAARRAPELFASLVLVGPSPRYVNDGDYTGGFDRSAIDELLDALDSNYLGWSTAMAPVIMGNPDRPQLLSDNRDDLAKVSVPTLVLQCKNDVIAPLAVGEYVRDAMPNATMTLLAATGHCPNLSAPEETVDAIRRFLGHAIPAQA